MKFSQIYGNDSVKRTLQGMADSGHVPHAILFYENDGCGALALGVAFLQYLNCKCRHDGDSCGECRDCNQISKLGHPDMHFTFPITSGTKVSGAVKDLTCSMFLPMWRELFAANPYFLENELAEALGFEKKAGAITVKEGGEILRKLSLSSVGDGWRGIFIYLPEKMNQQTANMLLKSLEEPAEKTIFILVTHSPESLLPTISSRCQLIRVMPLEVEEIESALMDILGGGSDGHFDRRPEVEAEKSPSLISQAATLSAGSLGAALQMINDSGDVSLYDELFHSLIDRIKDNDLSGALEVADALVGLDSRERQKAFCIYAGACVRKLFFASREEEISISGITSQERQWYVAAASSLNPKFPEAAQTILTRSVGMLERNVLQKMIFCNMVTRLFVAARKR